MSAGIANMEAGRKSMLIPGDPAIYPYDAILLKNVSGRYEGRSYEGDLRADDPYIGKEKAYRILKAASGQDFGYDVEKWTEWVNLHPFCIAAPRPLGSRLLESIRTGTSSTSTGKWPGYFAREDAYRQLCELSALDFGYSYDEWLLWMVENRPDLLEDVDP